MSLSPEQIAAVAGIPLLTLCLLILALNTILLHHALRTLVAALHDLNGLFGKLSSDLQSLRSNKKE